MGGAMKTCTWSNAGRFGLLASVLIMVIVCGSTSDASDVKQLWQSRDQFVALDRQDSPSGGGSIANDHPVEISPDRLTAILASIELQSPDSKNPEQLITPQSLEVLVPEMLQGFKKASPGEDVTFAVIGLYKTKLGFGKHPRVTTGRAFYKGGRLNIIFGFAQKDFNEREDRRLSPLIPGNRQKPLEGEWSIISQPGRNGFALVRKDWVIFSDEWRAVVAQAPVVEKVATPSQQAPVAEQNAPVVQAAPVQPVKQTDDTRKPADRLTTLNELKKKGLISEEEYNSKRLEILKGL
jgi:hypothetical protein